MDDLSELRRHKGERTGAARSTAHHRAEMSMDLAAILRAAMKARGINQAALAAKLAERWGKLPVRVNEKLSRWLNGHDDPRWSALVDVLDVLGLTIAKREP